MNQNGRISIRKKPINSRSTARFVGDDNRRGPFDVLSNENKKKTFARRGDASNGQNERGETLFVSLLFVAVI